MADNNSLFRSRRPGTASASPPPSTPSPQKPKDVRKRIAYVGGGVAVALFATISYLNSAPPKTPLTTATPTKPTDPNNPSGAISVVPGTQADQTAEAQYRKAQEIQQAQINQLTKQVEALSTKTTPPPTPNSSTPPPPTPNSSTQDTTPTPPAPISRPGQSTALPAPPTLPAPLPNPNTATPSNLPAPPLLSIPTSTKPPASKGPRVFNISETPAPAATPAAESSLSSSLKTAANALPNAIANYQFSNNANAGYLPAGAFVDISLLNGLDAGTSQTSQANPQPVIANVLSNATLPGNASYRLKGCFLVGSGYGEMATERVQIRFFKLSCVDKKDRLVVAQDIEANLVDSDGKLGMRGVVTEKQGAKMGKALLAGFASGLASALGSAQSSVLSNAISGTTTTITGSAALRASGLSGAQKATDMLADMYLKEAQALYPVITMDAGRRGSVMFTKGTPIQWMDVDTPINTNIQLKSAN